METKIVQRTNVLIATVLIVLAALLRLAPHPPNFAPVAALALFGGAVLSRRLAIIMPVSAMILSDLVIGLHSLVVVTWGCYALIALASSYWLKKPSLARTSALTISGSLFFFVITNLAVWLQGTLYPRTLAGLVSCYALALPFFRNTLLSDIIYTASLFGLYVLAIRLAQGFTMYGAKA